jgi:hypothetical protein
LSSDLDTLCFEETTKLVKYSIEANQPCTIEGPPGVGKTQLVYAIGRELKMEVVVVILSQCEPTDVGGFPFIHDGVAARLPLGPIKTACDKPVILFLDELTTAPPAVQGASLRLILERVAGDLYLHPGTRVVAAQNPVDQAAGGWEMSLPLIGRLTKVSMRPKFEEVQNFFFKLGDPGSSLRNVAIDLAATMGAEPKLLQMDPPKGASVNGTAWASPRSWERALRTMAVAADRGESDTSVVSQAILAGNVGPEAAAAFMNIRKIRNRLPSVADVERDPEGAKIPTDDATAIAALGIIAQVAVTDPCPALVYADRLPADARAACFTMLTKYRYKDHQSSKFYTKADDATKRWLKALGGAIRQR